MLNKKIWGRLFAGSLLSLSLLSTGCFLFEDDAAADTKDGEKKDGDKKDGDKKDGDKKDGDKAVKIEVPAYAPEGDDAEMKKAGAEGITADNAIEKAKEMEKALDEALAK